MRFPKLFIYFAVIAAISMVSTSVFADVKIKTKQTTSGSQSYENTTFIKGKRQRSEMAGGVLIAITQCDMRRDLQLNSQSKTYTVNPYDDGNPTAPSTTVSKSVETTKGGVVTTTVTNKDTGERKQMFGYTARHIIQTIETKSSPGSCSPVDSKMEIDAWYIDATFALDCNMNRYYRPYRNSKNGGCQDKQDMKTIGSAKTGYAVYSKMTMFDEGGKASFSTISEVTEISNATLDAGLFEAPADYKEVSDMSQMYSASSVANASGANGASGSSNAPASNSGLAKSVQNMSQNNAPAASSAVGDKKPGVVRLGVANVKTGSVGEGMSAQDLSAAIKNTMTEYLKSSKVELVQLDAKLPSAIADEAKEKQCDYVIYANVSHKKGGGGFGMFSKVIAPAISATGIGNTGSTAGNIAGAVATRSVYSAGQLAGNVKSKDEITLDIKLVGADNSNALAKQYKAKAKSDGEDIISQLIEQAAQAILDAAKI